MNLDFCLKQLEGHAKAIQALVAELTEEQARWKPDPETWSVLEVIHHLYDEEREDFRARLEIILRQSNEPWTPIDPAGWVSQRAYNQRHPTQVLQGFLDERQKSLAWLRSLGAPDWQVTAQAPWGGTIRAGDMLAAWVAHDVLHLRQLVELHWAYTTQRLTPFTVQYAGEW